MGKFSVSAFAVIPKQDSVCKCWNFPWTKPFKNSCSRDLETFIWTFLIKKSGFTWRECCSLHQRSCGLGKERVP